MGSNKKYPGPKRRVWAVQIEFLDGTVIDAMTDQEAVERWRRISAWTDESAESHPIDWMNRVLDRARTFYGCELASIAGGAPSTEILDALADEGAILLRRK